MPERLKVAPFDDWTYEDAVRELNEIKPTDYEIKSAYVMDRDHFQKGAEWVGPGDPDLNSSIEDQYAPEDTIGEVLANVSNAFMEPQLGCVPKRKKNKASERAEEAKALLTLWWDEQGLQEIIQERQRTAAWAGRAPLRLWIPWRFLEKEEENGVVTIRATGDMEQALRYIHVDNPMPDSAGIVTDSATQDKCAVYLSEEIYYDANKKKQTYKRAELVYLTPDRETDQEAQTIVRIVYSNKEKPDVISRLPLSGNSLFAEMQAAVLFTDPVLRTQRQLNLLTTLITRIAETAAFRERYTLNAKPQGTRYPYTEGDELQSGAYLERDDEGTLWQVIPTARTLGANTTTELVGLPMYDKLGDPQGNETPGIHIVDPVDPKAYQEAGDAVRRRILRMCGQGHLGGSSNFEVSGIAYEQARAVFEKDLNRRRVSEEGMLREILTAVLTLVETITDKDGYFTDTLRITVDQHVNPGPRSPDLVRLDLESYEAGLLSDETAMSRIGVEDVEAEKARLRKSVARILDVLDKVSGASNTFDADSILNALKELGLPDNVLSALKTKEEPEPEPVKEEEEDR